MYVSFHANRLKYTIHFFLGVRPNSMAPAATVPFFIYSLIHGDH